MAELVQRDGGEVAWGRVLPMPVDASDHPERWDRGGDAGARRGGACLPSPELVRRHLDGRLRALFRAQTGMTVRWASAPGFSRTTEEGMPVYCRLMGSREQGTAVCRGCLRQRSPAVSRHAAVCPFGVRTGWVPIRISGVFAGCLTCRALCTPLCNGTRKRVDELKLSRAQLARSSRSLPAASAAEFRRAVQILELIAEVVRRRAENALTQADLKRSARALDAHWVYESQLRKSLRRVIPSLPTEAPAVARESHAQRLAGRAEAFLKDNFHRPLGLREVADSLGLNTSYLSTLFARQVGIPFHRYLHTLRMERAQQLLTDPRQSITEVAYAVGFTDPNTFRLAFKRSTGLPPSAWRETFTAAAT